MLLLTVFAVSMTARVEKNAQLAEKIKPVSSKPQRVVIRNTGLATGEAP